MRFRGCPATGRMMHQFDKVTHRCKCGRWQAGFKPKTEPVRPRNECQICERTQALDAGGCLGHHGYKRPGHGFIEGDCPGVGHAPFPATNALEAYLEALEVYLAGLRNSLAAVEAAEKLSYMVEKRGPKREKLPPVEVIISKGDEYTYSREHGSLPGFDDLKRRRVAALENDIKFTEGDRTRVIARIAKGKELRA